MALVKKARVASRKPKAAAKTAPVDDTKVSAAKVATGAKARQTRAVERIAVATEQLASGVTEAAAAAEELRRGMGQVAAGADEAAAAAQEQSSAVATIASALGQARTRADASRQRTLALQVALAETSARISQTGRAIQRNADRQVASVEVIAQLERRAEEIGEITRTVTQVADQTNLLALNAAIEAARAGDHGRGFTVVAEEVRALAGISEKNAVDVGREAGLIQTEIRQIVVGIKEAASTASTEAGQAVQTVAAMEAMREDMVRLASLSDETLMRAAEAGRAAQEAERSAASVAAAAEEQAAAAAESQAALQQQTAALDQSQKAAHDLSRLAETLRTAQAASAVLEISSAANELSANVEELSSASAEINAAIAQISGAAQEQAAAAHESSAAMAQIEASARITKKNADAAFDRTTAMSTQLSQCQKAVVQLASGVERGIGKTRDAQALLRSLEAAGRRVAKLVAMIGSTALQTSMLAVSGAVEAARAGDSGRGFAVVSNDIRALAREASLNVDRIQEKVDSVIDQMISVRRDLDQILALAEADVERSRDVLGPLEVMANDTVLLVEASRDIQADAEAVLTAATTAAAGARQIAAAAEQAQSATREASNASAEQARGTENLAAAIEEIALLAQELTVRA